ncbi:MAG: hypothetical protein KBD19_01900 [Candidatus Moranbacteria bacterium]|nr:hypothetical protein [Candidatus Moranbacteria bacterium]
MFKWLNDIHFMSLLDLFQMLGSKLGKATTEEKKADGSDSAKTDKDLPTNLFTEKFTQVDNSYWEYILSLLPLDVYKTVRKLTDRMSEKDKADEGSRADSFRIGTLLMPNKITEEVIEKTVPGQQGQGGKGGGAKKETTTKRTDTRFDPDKDSRILYLTRLHEVTIDLIGAGQTEADVIDSVIDHLEKSGFLSTDSLKRKAEELFGKGKELAKEVSHKAKLASYHLFLGNEYDEVVRGRDTGKPDKDLEKDLSDALVSKTARDRRELKQAKRDRILHAKPKALGIIIGLMAAMIAAMSLIQFLK